MKKNMKGSKLISLIVLVVAIILVGFVVTSQGRLTKEAKEKSLLLSEISSMQGEIEQAMKASNLAISEKETISKELAREKEATARLRSQLEQAKNERQEALAKLDEIKKLVVEQENVPELIVE